MKKRVFRGVALALMLTLLCGAALAEVKTTGNVWMRRGPGLGEEQIVSLKEGVTLEYLGETSTDERGVDWYKVSDGKNTGWVSSKYTELTGEADADAPHAEVEVPADVPDPSMELIVPEGDGGDDAVELPAGTVELSVYYMRDLVETANEIGLISYRQVQSEAPFQYYDDSAIVAGNQNVENVVVHGPGYAVYGVTVGMDINQARACLNAAGLDFASEGNCVTYEHRGTEASGFVDENGHDSCVNLWVGEDGTVTEIDWSTYTG